MVFTPLLRGGVQPYRWVAENHDDNTPGGPAFGVDQSTGSVIVTAASLASTCGCLPEYEGVRYGDLHIEVTDAAGHEASQTIALAIAVTGCTQAACPTPMRTGETRVGGRLARRGGRIRCCAHTARDRSFSYATLV